MPIKRANVARMLRARSGRGTVCDARRHIHIATICGRYMTLCWRAGVKRSQGSQILYLYNDKGRNHLWRCWNANLRVCNVSCLPCLYVLHVYDLLGTIVMIKVSVPYFVITFYCVPLLLTAHSGLDGKSKGYLNNYLISTYYKVKP